MRFAGVKMLRREGGVKHEDSGRVSCIQGRVTEAEEVEDLNEGTV